MIRRMMDYKFHRAMNAHVQAEVMAKRGMTTEQYQWELDAPYRAGYQCVYWKDPQDMPEGLFMRDVLESRLRFLQENDVQD